MGGLLEFLDQHIPLNLKTFMYGATCWVDTTEECDWVAVVRSSPCR